MDILSLQGCIQVPIRVPRGTNVGMSKWEYRYGAQVKFKVHLKIEVGPNWDRHGNAQVGKSRLDWHGSIYKQVGRPRRAYVSPDNP